MLKDAEVPLASSQRFATNHDLYLAVAVHRDTGQLASDLRCNVPGQLIAMQPVEGGRKALPPAPVRSAQRVPAMGQVTQRALRFTQTLVAK